MSRSAYTPDLMFRAVLALVAATPAVHAAHAATPSPAGCISDALVTSDADDGLGTLRSAVAGLCDGGTIRFADRLVIDLASEIAIDKQVTIDGSSVAGDASGTGDALVQVRGGTDVRSFHVDVDGDLTLRRLRISNGAPNDLGGGVRSKGRLAVFDSRFDHNTGTDTGGLGGGAIFTDANSVLVVDGSTFDANDARRGSAIFAGGSSEISNSTFSDNGPTVQIEGAIQNRGTMVATHVTIARNGNRGTGGLFAFGADTTLINSIIAGNVGTQCQISGGTVTSVAILTQGSDCHPVLSDDPLLGPLDGNGGPTQTLALAPGSVAVDAADPEFCPPTDQRGVARPSGAACDLGAFELVDHDSIFDDGFDLAPVLIATR